MPITYQQSQQKAQYISGDNTAATLTQFQQDINIGYSRFNAAVDRYFSRKQQFTDIIADQQYYQVPVDSLRVMDVTVTIPNGYTYPCNQVRTEYEWRQMNIVPYTSNYATNYFIMGSDQIGLYPIPSDTVDAGLRFIYQEQDTAMSQDDYTTGTIEVTNGSTAITGTSTVWAQTQVGLYLQTTDGTDGNWYEIDSVDSSTTITLRTPYVGPSGSGKAYIIGQLMNIPMEYSDVAINYALMRYFESKNNPERAKYYKDLFDELIMDASARYASSSSSGVITGTDYLYNPWQLQPLPATDP